MTEEMPDALFHPACYPEEVKKVKMLQTHTSWVFLTGKYAYKIKKPVDFGFLDYSTLAKRKRFCTEELRLNRRLCPWLYLEVVPVVRAKSALRIGESGEVVDYAVKMRQLPQDAIMTQLVKRKKIGFELMDRMAKIVADFHDRTEVSDEISKYGSVETIRYNWEENFVQTEGFIGSLIKERTYEEIKENVERFVNENRTIFEERVKRGRVRWLHGDFHSGNIFVTDRIFIFDCIEFNPRFSCSDTAAEIAFFAMDMDFLGSRELGDYFLQRYIKYSGDAELLRLLDFYKSYRAYVRGKVLGFKAFGGGMKKSDRNVSEALGNKYFRLSHSYTRNFFSTPILVLVYGLPGVGKSFLARRLAGRLNLFHLRTDVLRKELASVPLSEHRYSGYGEGVYSEDMTVSTYGRILESARVLLVHGKGCILDGSFSKKEWRVRAQELATKIKVPLHSVYCECADDVALERMATRSEDPSDATRETYLKMKVSFDPPEPESIIVDTSQGVSRLIRPLLSKLTPK